MVFCNMNDVEFNTLINCHNPYFNRWFSAIYPSNLVQMHHNSHNPYFNRWFSAITNYQTLQNMGEMSQSLF